MITSAIHATHLISNDRAIQATSYYPYGLPMAESSFPDANRHKYSAKELVTHRGYDAYDFGPRNQLPTLCIFDNPDLLQEKFYGLHPSSYCSANPINYVDPDGNKVVFVHGMLMKTNFLRLIEIKVPQLGPLEGGKNYWNKSFINGANDFFHDTHSFFVDFDHSPADYRMKTGYQYAKQHYDDITEGMDIENDSFKFVTHSMGGVFAAGMQKYLSEQGWKIDQTVFINTYQSEDVHVDTSQQFIVDYKNTDDFVLNTLDIQHNSYIKGADVNIREKSNQPRFDTHSWPICEGKKWWEKLRELLDALQK